MSKQYYKQFLKIISTKVTLRARLRDREEPSHLEPILSEKDIKDISIHLLLVSQLEDELSAIC